MADAFENPVAEDSPAAESGGSASLIDPELLELSPPFQWARQWSKWSGAVPSNAKVLRGKGHSSPPIMNAYITLSIMFYFAFQIVWTGYTYSTARHTQTHGEA
jgi:hypothetical protein